MTFATQILNRLQDQPILLEASSVRFHKIGDQVFEISIDGKSVLLSTDAGIDLSYKLVEFLSEMERR